MPGYCNIYILFKLFYFQVLHNKTQIDKFICVICSRLGKFKTVLTLKYKILKECLSLFYAKKNTANLSKPHGVLCDSQPKNILK